MMPTPPPNGLFLSRVMHARVRPVRRRFTYRVFSLFIDIDDPQAATHDCAILSYDRFNILSFRARDHGRRDGSPLRSYVEDALQRAGLALRPDAIRLLCFPRLWGFVFNPLSVFYCYRRGRLAAVVYEVNNTFGDSHAYVACIEPDQAVARHEADKTLYVSPLIGMQGRYDFALRDPRERLSLAIRETGPEGLVLTAVQTGERRPLSTREAVKAVLRHPLMTIKVVAAIHIEALRTWLGGARYVARPVAAAPAVSLARTTSNRAGAAYNPETPERLNALAAE